jgi:Zn-dependent metalloprotease
MRVLLIALTTILLIVNSSYVYPQTSQVADKYGNQLLTKSNPITNSVKRIYGVKVPITRYGVSIEQINPNNIKQLGKSIIKDYEDILDISSNDLKVYRAKRGRNSSWHLGFRQLYKDVPIWRSYVRFTIEGQGLVNTISANIHPDIKLSVDPNISADDALSTVISAFIEDDTDTVTVREKPGLFIYPKTEENSVSYYLTYKVDLVSKDLLYFVDAFSGEIIEVINNRLDYNNNGTVSIKYFPEHYDDTSVVYDGFSGVYVKITNYLGQKMKDGYTNSNGQYNLTWYGGYSLYNLKGTGNFHLSNDYVDINAYDTFEHNYSFLPGSNHVHDWTYANDETNVFYHVNVIHDYITDSPFYFDDMDYQMDAYVHEGSGWNGWSNGTNIGFGSQSGYYWARSSDVVYHIHHLYDGWIGFPYTYTHGYAMDEGFADYFACTLNDHSRPGESVGLEEWRDLEDNERTMDDYVYSGWDKAPYWNGGIIAGAVWDMRETASIGDDLADELLFFALDRNPDEFGELLDDILYEDDTDADVSNGTPHIDAILYAFENHKIYPSDPDVPPSAPVLSGEVQSTKIHLEWNRPCPDVDKYDIWRKVDENNPSNWTKIATITDETDTDYDDTDFGGTGSNWTLHYKVKAIDSGNNESNYSNQVNLSAQYQVMKPIAGNHLNGAIPDEFILENAYPNPFNPVTKIPFGLPEDSNVKLEIYNLRGQIVATLVDGALPAGFHTARFDATSLPSGVYFYKIVAGNFSDIKRMLLIK